jgi:hypothetical protein
LRLNCGPVNTITVGLTGLTINRERIKPGVRSENLPPVLTTTNIIIRLVRLTHLIEVFDCGLILGGKLDMEPQKDCNHDSENTINDISDYNHYMFE